MSVTTIESDGAGTDNFRIESGGAGTSAYLMRGIKEQFLRVSLPDEKIDFGSDASLFIDQNTKFTWSWWTDSDGTGGGALSRYDFAVKGFIVQFNSGVIRVFVRGNNGLLRIIKHGSTVFTGNPEFNFNHVAVTWDALGGANEFDESNIRIHVNGVEESSYTIIDNDLDGSFATPDPLLLNMDAHHDELSVWSDALTEAQIAQIHAKGRDNVKYTDLPFAGDLISHWRMDSYNPKDRIGNNDGTGILMDVTNETIV